MDNEWLEDVINDMQHVLLLAVCGAIGALILVILGLAFLFSEPVSVDHKEGPVEAMEELQRLKTEQQWLMDEGNVTVAQFLNERIEEKEYELRREGIDPDD